MVTTRQARVLVVDDAEPLARLVGSYAAISHLPDRHTRGKVVVALVPGSAV